MLYYYPKGAIIDADCCYFRVILMVLMSIKPQGDSALFENVSFKQNYFCTGLYKFQLDVAEHTRIA